MRFFEYSIFVFIVGSVVTAQNKCPSQLLPIAGKGEAYQWSNRISDQVQYAVCGFIKQSCGVDPSQLCSQQSTNCTVACQSWADSDNPTGAGATLGQNLLSTNVMANEIVLVYGHGDNVIDSSTGVSTPRGMTIHYVCGAAPLKAIKYIPPSVTFPPPPVYMSTLYVQTKYACGMKPKSCGEIGGCSACTNPVFANVSGAPCAFCLDDGACHSLAGIRKDHSCDNYVTAPSSCPGALCGRIGNCRNCAGMKFEGGSCFWCDGKSRNSCQEDNIIDNCDGGEFRNSSRCPQ